MIDLQNLIFSGLDLLLSEEIRRDLKGWNWKLQN